MLHAHLKHALRLNRVIGVSFVVYGAFALLTLVADPQHWGPYVRLGLMAVLNIAFLLVNELSLKALKRHPKMDELMLEKFSLLLPLIGVAVVSLSYLLTGQLGIFMCSALVILQAQLFGLTGMARIISVMMVGVYLASLPLGYPHLVGFTAPGHLGLYAFLALAPFAFGLFYYGTVASNLVRNTTSKVSKLQSLAATDALTGLINRRQFNHQLDAEIARARRYRKPLSLALFDIDDFKKINDFYGHTTGDRILKELGGLITVNVRESDIPARYGGEEFALILPETGQIDAYEILERLRAMIERTVFCLPDNPMTISVSVGVAQLDMENAKAFELIEKADAALYEAKKQGKNRVVYGVVPAPKITYPPFGPSSSA